MPKFSDTIQNRLLSPALVKALNDLRAITESGRSLSPLSWCQLCILSALAHAAIDEVVSSESVWQNTKSLPEVTRSSEVEAIYWRSFKQTWGEIKAAMTD